MASRRARIPRQRRRSGPPGRPGPAPSQPAARPRPGRSRWQPGAHPAPDGRGLAARPAPGCRAASAGAEQPGARPRPERRRPQRRAGRPGSRDPARRRAAAQPLGPGARALLGALALAPAPGRPRGFQPRSIGPLWAGCAAFRGGDGQNVGVGRALGGTSPPAAPPLSAAALAPQLLPRRPPPRRSVSADPHRRRAARRPSPPPRAPAPALSPSPHPAPSPPSRPPRGPAPPTLARPDLPWATGWCCSDADASLRPGRRPRRAPRCAHSAPDGRGRPGGRRRSERGRGPGRPVPPGGRPCPLRRVGRACGAAHPRGCPGCGPAAGPVLPDPAPSPVPVGPWAGAGPGDRGRRTVNQPAAPSGSRPPACRAWAALNAPAPQATDPIAASALGLRQARKAVLERDLPVAVRQDLLASLDELEAELEGLQGAPAARADLDLLDGAAAAIRDAARPARPPLI